MWQKFVNYMHNICGMQYDAEEGFVVCSECGDPIYEVDFDGDRPVCPCCGYNIETEHIEDEYTDEDGYNNEFFEEEEDEE